MFSFQSCKSAGHPSSCHLHCFGAASWLSTSQRSKAAGGLLGKQKQAGKQGLAAALQVAAITRCTGLYSLLASPGLLPSGKRVPACTHVHSHTRRHASCPPALRRMFLRREKWCGFRALFWAFLIRATAVACLLK